MLVSVPSPLYIMGTAAVATAALVALHLPAFVQYGKGGVKRRLISRVVAWICLFLALLAACLSLTLALVIQSLGLFIEELWLLAQVSLLFVWTMLAVWAVVFPQIARAESLARANQRTMELGLSDARLELLETISAELANIRRHMNPGPSTED